MEHSKPTGQSNGPSVASVFSLVFVELLVLPNLVNECPWFALKLPLQTQRLEVLAIERPGAVISGRNGPCRRLCIELNDVGFNLQAEGILQLKRR